MGHWDSPGRLLLPIASPNEPLRFGMILPGGWGNFLPAQAVVKMTNVWVRGAPRRLSVAIIPDITPYCKTQFFRILYKFNSQSAPGGSRTPNLGLRRASLYPLSYWGICVGIIACSGRTGKRATGMGAFLFVGKCPSPFLPCRLKKGWVPSSDLHPWIKYNAYSY